MKKNLCLFPSMTLSPCSHLISDIEGCKNEELSLNFHRLVIVNTNPSQLSVCHLGGPESPLTKFDFATFFFREDWQTFPGLSGTKGNDLKDCKCQDVL